MGGEGVPTLDRKYLLWMGGEGVPTLDGGREYLPFTGEGYLPWMGGVSNSDGERVPILW